MVEKDMENLIANHPDDFFPAADFKLKGQQIKIGKYYADIIFVDKYSRLIILEIKKGTLTRDAVGQIIDYYGILKQENPSQHIELILCANFIPSERKTFLERLGIECKEISEEKFRNIANKYQYKFLDEVISRQELPEERAAMDTNDDGNIKLTKWEPDIKKQKYFTLTGLSREGGKRSKLFNRIKELATTLKPGEVIVKKISELIGETFVAKGLARKIQHDLSQDYGVNLKIKEKSFQEFKGRKGMVSPRPTEYEITRL